jgi:hypothetical protein
MWAYAARAHANTNLFDAIKLSNRLLRRSTYDHGSSKQLTISPSSN